MLHLSENQLSKLADPNALIKAIEKSILIYDTGQYNMPLRLHMESDQNTHLIMPALTKDGYLVKLVNVYPENKAALKPVIQGIATLFDGASGSPIATFDGAALTAYRTAAVVACSVKYLSDSNARSIGLVGLGVQATHALEMIQAIRPIQRIHLFDYNPIQTSLFSKQVGNDLEVSSFNEVDQLIEKSDIILTSTNSHNPVLSDNYEVYKNQFICAIGSYKPKMQELNDVIFSQLDSLYCDTFDGLKE
ncbi:MAG: hypothetical protein AAGK97_10730, partial [Bacteroidota bacterium]